MKNDSPFRLKGSLPLIAAAVANLAFGPAPAKAGSDPSEICEQAAAIVSQETGVPFDVLMAISLTETGRASGGVARPWPWTINMEGDGFWFESEDDARAYVYQHFKRGARSFDVGCFQLNYKWHHENFSSLDEMFDPLAGGRYAAKFLSDLYAEKGDWKEAAGAYHSRTPEYANRYMAIFSDHFKSLEGKQAPIADMARLASIEDPVAPTTAPEQPKQTRVNTFPLLQGGTGSGRNGSLVPLTKANSGRSLVDFNGAG